MALTQKINDLFTIFKYRVVLKEVVKSYLYFLRFPKRSTWGSITAEEEAGLQRAISLAAGYAGPIIEIGTLFGHTTNLLAALKSKDKLLISVDNFCWNPFQLPPDLHRQFTLRTLRHSIEHGNTRLVDSDAHTFYSRYSDATPSMIFIDADHSYEAVKRDIAWAIAVGIPVISGHDFIDFFPGVCRAVREAFGADIELFGGVWIATHRANAAIAPATVENKGTGPLAE